MEQNNKRLIFLPLGGSGEIGMNLNLYGYGEAGQEKWIMIDCGVMFGERATPGIDLQLPDFRWIHKNKKNLQAIILTHAHEDHIGALAHIWPQLQVPMYATAFTAMMIQAKLADYGVPNFKQSIYTIPMNKRFAIGDFALEYVPITHSIPESTALLIDTPKGRIFHTGDWKFDDDPQLGTATDLEHLKKIGDSGVLACICDSTNALDSGRSGSEASVVGPLAESFRHAEGRVAVTTFASNAARLRTILHAAVEAKRRYVLCGRSIEKMFRMGRTTGFFRDLPEPISDKIAKDMPRRDVIYICTGSQGEERSGLWRIASGRHPVISLQSGDIVVFSSKTIPGNEKSVSALYNALAMRGVEVLTSKHLPLHVSGHPCQDELKQMYELIRPRLVVPVHGEYRHMLAHSRLATTMPGVLGTQIPCNGMMIELAPRPLHVLDTLPNQRLHVDGYIIENSQNTATSQRISMSHTGFLAVSIPLSPEQRLMGMPSVIMHGIPDLSHLLEGEKAERYFARRLARDIESLHLRERSFDRLKSTAINLLKKGLDNLWGKRPIIHVDIMSVSGKKMNLRQSRHLTMVDQRADTRPGRSKQPISYAKSALCVSGSMQVKSEDDIKNSRRMRKPSVSQPTNQNIMSEEQRNNKQRFNRRRSRNSTNRTRSSDSTPAVSGENDIDRKRRDQFGRLLRRT